MTCRRMLSAVLAFATLAAAPRALAGDTRSFDVSTIAPDLKRDVDRVVRDHVEIFELLGPGHARHSVRDVVTVLNARGRDAGVLVLPYDRFQKVRSLAGRVLDARGREIRVLKNSEIDDYSAIQGFSLYEEGRVKFAELYHSDYPYTVVFDYSIEHDGLLGWPSWWPLDDRASVERSIFEIRAPHDQPVRYKAVGFDLEPRIIESGDRLIYQWALTDQPKMDIEPLGPSYDEQAPHLLTGPAEFEIAGFRGNMATWSEFGSWFYGLWEGEAVLPEADAVEVRSLCSGIDDAREKTRRLYERLQAKTRYVSVQLGIGGWKPFDASYVSRLGYGDCKALTNYMKAMLDAAGVPSYPAFVLAGDSRPDLRPDFPSNQFNHVILFIPLPGDTVWLECTSRNCDFGELGTFTEDRYTLVCLPEGSRLVRTPATRADENRLDRRTRVLLGTSGQANVEMMTRYTGNQQGDVRGRLASATPSQREEWLLRDVPIPNFTIQAADFSDVDRKSRQLSIRATLQVPALATASGPRLFIAPNVANRWTVRLPAASRRQPVRLPYPSIDCDTVSIRIPQEFTVEAAPAGVRLETPFGAFESAVTVNSAGIEYHRRLELRQKSIEISDYDAFRRFVDEIVKADQSQVVLIRKT